MFFVGLVGLAYALPVIQTDVNQAQPVIIDLITQTTKNGDTSQPSLYQIFDKHLPLDLDGGSALEPIPFEAAIQRSEELYSTPLELYKEYGSFNPNDLTPTPFKTNADENSTPLELYKEYGSFNPNDLTPTPFKTNADEKVDCPSPIVFLSNDDSFLALRREQLRKLKSYNVNIFNS
jgi:hypothetical protein